MKFGITGNLEKEELPSVLESLLDIFREHDVQFNLDDALSSVLRKGKKRAKNSDVSTLPMKKLISRSDAIIALGGDGTILKLARLIGSAQTPILGVNIGKLGFLAEISQDEMKECLVEIFAGKYSIENRMMLEASTDGFKSNYSALNDIVLEKYGSSRMMTLETYVNEEYLATYAADGIILSTPTGSTAYSLANYGPIIAPTNNVIVINPICPHTLTARPVILPDDSLILIKLLGQSQKASLTADGQQTKLLNAPATVRIRKAPFVARLMKREKSSYFDVLRKKLHWGSDVRIKGKSKN